MVEIKNTGEHVTADIKGDIDHHNAANIRSEIDAVLENSTPRVLILDFAGVKFMDSSGIGLILGRKRVLDGFGGKLFIKNAVGHAEKIIKMAGLSGLILK
ncbi:MAG: STAS domain-containing protein [Oscillospiraceae bacterium]|nr:STAS domain-containing protein [Oscillospiraceae bacterium]